MKTCIVLAALAACASGSLFAADTAPGAAEAKRSARAALDLRITVQPALSLTMREGRPDVRGGSGWTLSASANEACDNAGRRRDRCGPARWLTLSAP